MTDKEEREVRRYDVKYHGMGPNYSMLYHLRVPAAHAVHLTSVVSAADYDAANRKVKDLEAKNEEAHDLFYRVMEKVSSAWDYGKGPSNSIEMAEELAKKYRAFWRLVEEKKTLQQQTQQLVEAAGKVLDAPLTRDNRDALREALKPFQKGEANESD